MKQKNIFRLFCVTLTFTACGDPSADRGSLYGPVAPEKYLTGQFNPGRHPGFVKIAGLGIPQSGAPKIMRREAGQALQKMYRAFKKAHPGIPFRVVSATRNFYSQKGIWEGKWTGRRKVQGLYLPRSHPNAYKRGLLILRYSSMPGTSRHHWGTDVDINNLTNAYFKSGQGAILFRWLRKNAATYGFCQPYTAGRKAGYQEERWHWSYRPLAVTFLHNWMKLYKNAPGNVMKRGSFAGVSALSKLAPVYVNGINAECK